MITFLKNLLPKRKKGNIITLSRNEPLANNIQHVLAHIPLDFGGGCSASKAFVIADLIRQFKMKTSLDIGVYRGRSLAPQSLAHKFYTNGKAYGVDPWSKFEAQEHDNQKLKEQIAAFVEETDFEALYQNVRSLLSSFSLDKNTVLVRKTSKDAAAEFRKEGITFDLIHIDGNHDTAPVLQDVEDYLPLLNPNGILVMDDVSWDSVKPAVQIVGSKMPKMFERVDTYNDYAVFWNVPLGTAFPAWSTLFKEHFVLNG
jgi:hypothetical protein